MGMVHRAIWYLRVKKGVSISKRVERYIVEELEEDLFPYGFGGDEDEDVIRAVWDFVDRFNAGEINIYKPASERILERYEALKEEHLYLLYQMNQMTLGYPDWERDDTLPF
jgi:hypothetical protein